MHSGFFASENNSEVNTTLIHVFISLIEVIAIGDAGVPTTSLAPLTYSGFAPCAMFFRAKSGHLSIHTRTCTCGIAAAD